MTPIILFPGQGAQRVGMAHDFYKSYPSVQNLFKVAREQSGFDCVKLLFESNEAELKETEKTQVAVTLANLASYRALQENGLNEANTLAVAGFSLGEYAALVAAKVCSEADIFTLVRERGRLMAKAGKAIIENEGEVGMAAIVGLSTNKVEEIVKAEGKNKVFCANYNAPNQTIISGLLAGIDKLEPMLKEAGARRVLKLNVSGPFHTPFLHKAGDEFAVTLSKITFNNPQTKLVSNVTGAIVTTGDEVKTLLQRQISSPVQWVACQQVLKTLALNDTVIAECGPGNVLSGLWKTLFNENIKVVGNLEQAKELGN
jgi:[acyl-carrier-protein] S-malonyltransferase